MGDYGLEAGGLNGKVSVASNFGLVELPVARLGPVAPGGRSGSGGSGSVHLNKKMKD